MADTTQLIHDKTLNKGAGYLDVVPETAAPSTGGPAEPLKNPHQQTLLNLVHHLLYTREGRDSLRNNLPVNGVLSSASRAALLAKFATFGVLDPAVQNAVLDAHIAGATWVQLNELGPTKAADRAEQERVYLQKASFVAWCLWEDAKAHEFSMAW
jgi:hypothetical protein